MQVQEFVWMIVSSPRGGLRPLGRYALIGATFVASSLAAQMISIPLGGPRPERPSPNAALRGAPADLAVAVEARGRRPAMRRLDDTRHPVEVLEFLGLSRGVRALVVEPDIGYYGQIIGMAAGNGGRVAELIPPAAMHDPATRAALSDDISLVPSLSLLAALPATVRLVPESLDFVLLYRAYPMISAGAAPDAQRAAVAAFVRKLSSAVRPGGIVGIVDGGTAIDGDRSDEAAATKRDFADAGLVLDGEGHLSGSSEAEHDERTSGTIAVAGSRLFILRFRKPE